MIETKLSKANLTVKDVDGNKQSVPLPDGDIVNLQGSLDGVKFVELECRETDDDTYEVTATLHKKRPIPDFEISVQQFGTTTNVVQAPISHLVELDTTSPIGLVRAHFSEGQLNFSVEKA